MESLNKGHIYNQDMFHVATDKEVGADWPILWWSGNSCEDGHDYTIETNHLHGDEIPEAVMDAKDTAELIAKLLNLYMRGFLFVGNPNQVEMFKDR